MRVPAYRTGRPDRQSRQQAEPQTNQTAQPPKPTSSTTPKPSTPDQQPVSSSRPCAAGYTPPQRSANEHCYLSARKLAAVFSIVRVSGTGAAVILGRAGLGGGVFGCCRRVVGCLLSHASIVLQYSILLLQDLWQNQFNLQIPFFPLDMKLLPRLYPSFSTAPKPRILTGIQPTGNLTLGNHLGSIDNLLRLTHQHPHSQTFIFIADLHSLTTAFDLEHAQIKYDDRIGSNTLAIAKSVISSGVRLGIGIGSDAVMFVQSDVKEHAELCWILGCLGPQHWLNMMIQYKEKSTQNSSLGIYSYPVLMAADILLYKANYVPVGEDQKQHLELARRYAQRFNSIIGKQFFPIPNYMVAKTPRVMSLTDPSKKMSKSDANERSRINMTDSKDQIAEKIRRSVTDAEGNVITYEPEKRKGLANLIRIYGALKSITNQQVVTEFTGKGIKQFKAALTELISQKVQQIQHNMANLSDQQTKQILRDGAQKARKEAAKTIDQIKQLLKLFR